MRTGYAFCPACPRRLADWNGVRQHIKAKHKSDARRLLGLIPHKEPEPSIADQVIAATIAQACGEPVEDWLREMLP